MSLMATPTTHTVDVHTGTASSMVATRTAARVALVAPMALLATMLAPTVSGSFALLDPADYEPYFIGLPEVGGITGAAAFAFAKEQLPFIDLPASTEEDIMAAYYYRTKVLREHIIDTGFPDAPFAVSECKFPTTQANMSAHPPTIVNGTVGCLWGDQNGVINAASGHHIAEGSWLRDPKYMNSYLNYFFKGAHYPNGTRASTYSPRTYTSWQVTAALKKLKNDGDLKFVASLLPAFVSNFQGWVREHRLDQMQHTCTGANLDPSKGGDWWALCPDLGKPPCFYMPDGWDAMEGSVSGTGCRPSLGAAMYGEAAATAAIAALVAAAPSGSYNSSVVNATEAQAIAAKFSAVATDIRTSFLGLYWNKATEHFAVYKSNTTHHGWNPQDPQSSIVGWECGVPFAYEDQNYSSNHDPCDQLVQVRELFALSSPWYFGVVPRMAVSKYEAPWKLLLDNTTGYAARWGLRTATLQAPGRCSECKGGPNTPTTHMMDCGPVVGCNCYNHTYGECAWDAPIWPYETARVLSGLANLLQPEEQYSDAQRAASGLSHADFHALLSTYAASMTQGHVAGGRAPPYVGENIHPDEGYWIARQRMYWGGSQRGGQWPMIPTPDRERSVDYMHSTFLDNVLGGLIGLRGHTNASVVVSPLVDATRMTHFAVDNLKLHGREVAVSWDPTGRTYHRRGCAGLCVFVDGEQVASAPALGPLKVAL